MSFCVLIPAYKPDAKLPELVAEIARTAEEIIVVNDGSGPEFDEVFQKVAGQPRVTLAEHAVNLGKGAALKTGINAFLCKKRRDMTLVTADADGQHLPVDIASVGRAGDEEPRSLVLGARKFDPENPLRSRFGNIVTRHVLRVVVGCNLTDTQTGLRAIPADLMPKLLKLTTRGYEFELDMLVLAKQLNLKIKEVPISTVYLNGNQSSHFDPLVDSMRIYFVLLRFALASLATALLDYSVFSTVFAMGGSIIGSQAAARGVALCFNYFAVKKLVFYSDQKHSVVFPRYAAVVVISGLLSYGLIMLIKQHTVANVFAAKLIAETLVFIANFAVLREFIFVKREPEGAES